MSIGSVILPLDFSSGAARAVRPAGAVAARFGVRVLPVTSRFGWDDKDPARELAALTAEINDVVGPARVEDRFASNLIADIVAASPGALVCMATHGRQGLARLTGSVAEDVLRRVNGPVLLVGPAADADPTADTGPVLVCSDGSGVSQSIVPIARDWLATTGQPVELVSVVRRDEYADSTRARLSEVAADLTGLPPESVSVAVLLDDDAAAAIVVHARNRQAPLIAMATHGRTGVERITVGSVTTQVVRDAPCPVLTARPASLGPDDSH